MKFSPIVIVAIASVPTFGSAFLVPTPRQENGRTIIAFVSKSTISSSSRSTENCRLQAMSANDNFFGYGYYNPRGTIQFPGNVENNEKEPKSFNMKPISDAKASSITQDESSFVEMALDEPATSTVMTLENVDLPEPVYDEPVLPIQVAIAEKELEQVTVSTTFSETTSNPLITKEQVRSLFTLWNDALATGDSRLVASRYSEEPILLPTISDTPRTDYKGVKDYFDTFLLRKPQGKIVEGHVKIIGDTMCSDTGIYEFTMGTDGSKVKARYSFVYVYEKGEWKISHHHSSVMPEEITVGQIITKDQVRGLFDLWNTALQSGDAREVALRYARKGVMIPPVSSSEPRTDYHSIKEYFETFLKQQTKPKAITILQSNVMIGKNWCQDAGIYEFTMDNNNNNHNNNNGPTKVRARYTFVYVYENNEWKIAHHHSSPMPEAPKGEIITEQEVQSLFYLWNDALASGDAAEVAHRYAEKAVLLPTSGEPRKDYYEIKEYYTNYLKMQPRRGRILESNVVIGENWAQDAGIYEITSQRDGSVTRARYTFLYVFERGEWKISHHHSSEMPAAIFKKSTIKVPKAAAYTTPVSQTREEVLTV